MKVLIADRHDLYREGIRGAIQSRDNTADLETAGVPAFDDAFNLLQSGEKYDLFLLDAKITNKDELKNIARLKKRFPALPVLIMTSEDESICLCSLKRTGVEGLVYKTVEGDELSKSVKRIVSGQTDFPSTACQHSEDEEAERTSRSEQPHLTSRQRQVLELMAEGRSNRDIAGELTLAEGTVKIHVTAILRALKVTNRTQAVIMAADLD